MPSTTTDRLLGINGGAAIKVPCRVATTANITLSGLQTIDGVVLEAYDRVLVKDQTNQADNGIWLASANSWTRAADLDGDRDAVNGTLAFVNEGSTSSATFWHIDCTDPLVIGTDNIVWLSGLTGVTSATETTAGILEVATQAETDAGAVDTKIVTPLKLATTLPNYVSSTSQAQTATNNTTFMSPSKVKTQLDYRGRRINIKDYGAKCDGQAATLTASITNGTAALTLVGGSFTSSDIGKLIAVEGAGAAGAVLTTTIAAVTDTTHITLGTNASTTLSAVSKIIAWGTDDLAAWNSALAAATATDLHPVTVEFLGWSAVSDTITIPNVSNLVIEGMGGGWEAGSAGTIFRGIASKVMWLGGTTNNYIMSAGNGGVGNACMGLKLKNFGLDGVYTSLNRFAFRLNQLVQNGAYEGMLYANVNTGMNFLASSFSNNIRDCKFFRTTTYGINLQELDHSTNIEGCTFANYASDTDTPTCIAIGTGGSGTFHSSVVNIKGNNFNNTKVVRWIDAQDAHNVNIIGNYFEGNDSSMTAGITLGRTADANKVVDGCVILGNRITTASGDPAATAIDCQRVSGLHVAGNYFSGWTASALKIDHTNSNNIVWAANDHGSVTIADSNGVALSMVARGVGVFTGKFGDNVAVAGATILNTGVTKLTATAAAPLEIYRSNDGTLVNLASGGTIQGTISISGTTTTYAAFCGSHVSQFGDKSKPDILRGTVLESIDAMAKWEGEANDQLAAVKVSDKEASRRVYGVFFNWTDGEADMLVASLGAFVVRIKPGEVVEGGDYLESNGDGTARKQVDDILRSSTIAKVTSNYVVETFHDGSYLVPCTLHCG